MSPPARALTAVVRFYQRLAAGRPSPCRFVPSCSNYALDALETHGAGRGTWLTTRRLCRCHPWGGQGWDPVPDREGHLAPPPGAALVTSPSPAGSPSGPELPER